MFKWLYTIRHSSDANFDISEQENFKKARYQFIGALVLFISILVCAPFLIKKTPTENKSINMRLIHKNMQKINKDDGSLSSKKQYEYEISSKSFHQIEN